MFGLGKKDKKERGTLKKGDQHRIDSSKSPRADNSSQDAVPVYDDGDDNSMLVFSVGETQLKLTHRKLLNDSTFYDMDLHLAAKKSAGAKVHRAVLQVRCPQLLVENKFIGRIDKTKSRWQATISEQALPSLTPTTLSQLMQYIYAGSMDTPRFSLPTLLDMSAVGGALAMDEVVWMCEHRVRELLTIDTVHVILKGAEDRGLVGVKNFALEFAFTNWSEFIGNQEGAKILGLELFQDVSAKYAKGEKLSFPEAAQPKNTVVADYRRLYEEMPAADVQIEVGGTKLNCHRAILGMYSDGLAYRLKHALKGPAVQAITLVDASEHQAPLTSASAVESFLRFVYYGETKMDPLDACEMIHKCNSVYKLSTFQLLCEHVIINNINARSVLPILGVSYIKPFDNKPHIQALRKQALAYLIAHFASTDLDSLTNMTPEIRTDLLVALQKAFRAGKLGSPDSAYTDTHSGDEEQAVAVDSE